MNKRDAINHIRQFGGRLDRFRKSVGGSGDGGRNAPKRAKSSPKPVNRKTNVFNEQVRYAFHGALQDPSGGACSIAGHWPFTPARRRLRAGLPVPAIRRTAPR